MWIVNRWNRLDAPGWVGRLLVLGTLVLAGAALYSLLVGLFAPALVALVLAALLGWLTSAWNAERRWAWHVLCALEVLDVLGQLADAGGRSLLSTALHLVLPLGVLALLLHPATRARLDPPERTGTAVPSGRHAPGGGGRPPRGRA